MKYLPLKYACNTAAHSQNKLYTRTNQPSLTDEETKAPESKKTTNYNAFKSSQAIILANAE
jgi:hypothetical protein